MMRKTRTYWNPTSEYPIRFLLYADLLVIEGDCWEWSLVRDSVSIDVTPKGRVTQLSSKELSLEIEPLSELEARSLKAFLKGALNDADS